MIRLLSLQLEVHILEAVSLFDWQGCMLFSMLLSNAFKIGLIIVLVKTAAHNTYL